MKGPLALQMQPHTEEVTAQMSPLVDEWQHGMFHTGGVYPLTIDRALKKVPKNILILPDKVRPLPNLNLL